MLQTFEASALCPVASNHHIFSRLVTGFHFFAVCDIRLVYSCKNWLVSPDIYLIFEAKIRQPHPQ